MKLIKTMNLHIPAGLVDDSVEFFLAAEGLMVSENGITSPFMEMSVRAATLLRGELDNNPVALKAIEKMGIDDPLEQLYQYAKCRYADCNSVGDLNEDGSNPEFYNCGKHARCHWEGILCVPLKAPFGDLTSRELDVISLIIEDLPNKIIADRLGITPLTVHTHIRHIEEKTGAFTKVGVTRFALEHHIQTIMP